MPITTLPDLPAPPSPLTSPQSCPLMPLWACTVIYERDSGLRAAPVCGPPGTPARFIQVHGGKAKKIIKWIAVGWGAKPPLPSANTQSINEVLLNDVRSLPAAGKSGDGADIFVYRGEYHYGLQVCPSDTDVLTGAVAPYQTTPNLNVYQLNPSDFSTLFTGPSITPADIVTLKRVVGL